jgi:hypothetical protein
MLTDRVPAAICRCGCDELLIYLRLPPMEGESPATYFRWVPCYPEGWDGCKWYSRQCRRHPTTKKVRAIWKKLPPELSLD